MLRRLLLDQAKGLVEPSLADLADGRLELLFRGIGRLGRWLSGILGPYRPRPRACDNGRSQQDRPKLSHPALSHVIDPTLSTPLRSGRTNGLTTIIAAAADPLGARRVFENRRSMAPPPVLQPRCRADIRTRACRPASRKGQGGR